MSGAGLTRAEQESIPVVIIGAMVLGLAVFLLSSQPLGSEGQKVVASLGAAGLFAVISAAIVYRWTNTLFSPVAGPANMVTTTDHPSILGALAHAGVFAGLSFVMMNIPVMANPTS